MIKRATYGDRTRDLVITASEPEVWIETEQSVINFPGIVELEGDSRYMPYHRRRHGGVEPLASVVSSNLGASWHPAPGDSPFIDMDQITGLNIMDFRSGIIGYPKDGTTTRIDTHPIENYERPYSSDEAPHHVVVTGLGLHARPGNK
jgi:hypothetical protein